MNFKGHFLNLYIRTNQFQLRFRVSGRAFVLNDRTIKNYPFKKVNTFKHNNIRLVAKKQ